MNVAFKENKWDPVHFSYDSETTKWVTTIEDFGGNPTYYNYWKLHYIYNRKTKMNEDG